MGDPVIRLTACTLDLASRTVTWDDGETRRLSPRGTALLRYLAQNPNELVQRDALIDAVWGGALPLNSRAVDTAIARLRTKIERDPKHPDHLVTLYGDGYRLVVPNRSAERRTNIGPQHEGFVGRQHELQLLHQALTDPEVHTQAVPVTLVGPPGAGKTHLATEFARRAMGRLPGGAWLCDLSDTAHPHEVLSAVLDAVSGGPPQRGGAEVLRLRLAALSRHGPVLVVLDNCEQAVHAVCAVIEILRSAGDAIRILATSRRPLDVAHERVVSLPQPNLDDAIAMFCRSARRVRDDFSAADQRPMLVEVVERLDRLPLALTLAASRLGAMSLTALRDRLDQRFRLLTTRNRGASPRHRTLRATLDGSWDLLSPDQRHVLMGVSVFRGGFTTASVIDLLGQPDTAAHLEMLRSWCLLLPGGAGRWAVYMFVREYAEGQLAQHPELQAQLFRRHADALVEIDDPNALSLDGANLAIAMQRSIDLDRNSVTGPLAILRCEVLSRAGSMAEVRQVVERALAFQGLAPEHEVQLCAIGASEFSQGRDERAATQMVDRAIAVAEAHDDDALHARALRCRGTHRRRFGDTHGAESDLGRAIELSERLQMWRVFAAAQQSLALVLRKRADLDGARACYQRVLDLGDRPGAASRCNALAGLGQVTRALGDLDAARDIYRQALPIQRARNDTRMVARLELQLGNIELDAGQFETSLAHYTDAHATLVRLGDRLDTLRCEGNIGLLCTYLGRYDEAERWLAAATDELQVIGQPLDRAIGLGNLGDLYRLCGDFDRADRCLRQSIEICREQQAEGVEHIMGTSYVWVAVTREDWAEARLRMQQIEIPHEKAHGARALAARGHIEAHEGGPAWQTLARAEAMVAGLSARAPAATDVASLRARLEAS